MQSTISYTKLGLAALILLLSSCDVGPRYHAPCPSMNEEWKYTTEDLRSPEVCNWWDLFQDETLDRLIQTALQNNHDLKSTIEKVVQTRAQTGIVKANLYPQITLNPSYSNEIYLTEAYGANAVTGGHLPVPLFREHLLAYQLPVNLNWEIDLWGQLKDFYESALYTSQAEYDALKNLLLLVTTDIADRYFRVRTLDTELDIYLQTIETRKKALSITQARYESKLADNEAASQAALDLANVEADYCETKRQRDILENSIATLIGVSSSDFHLEHNPLREPPPAIPAGLPSDLLLQRPDILEAERNMASQHALVKAAYAAFFPSFSLTGALGYSSPDMQHFLTWRSRYWNIGGNLLQVLFDGGRLISNLQLEWAMFRQADEDYQQTVLRALQEVNDALGDIKWYNQEGDQLATSVAASSTTYQITFDRYLEGVNYYLPVVDSERDKLTAERRFNSVLGLRYSATIQLIKAIGGGWQEIFD